MRGVAVIALVALLAGARAELKVGPNRDADLENTTLGLLTYQGPIGVRAPPKPLVGLPMYLRAPRGRPEPGRQWALPRGPPTAAVAGAGAPLLRAAVAAAAAAEAEAPKPPESSGLNVYGEQLGGCASEGDLCTYTGTEPRVCAKAGQKLVGAGGGASFEAIYQCQSILKWDGTVAKPAQPASVKCDAVPSEALEMQPGMEAWSKVWMKSLTGSLSKSGLEESPKQSRRAKKFRTSIDALCQSCASTAASESARSTLTQKCTAIMEQVNAGAPTMFAQSAPDIFSGPVAALIGLFVGSGVAFVALRFRRGGTAAALG